MPQKKAPVRRVSRTDKIARSFAEWAALREQEKLLGERVDTLKSELSEAVEEYGYQDNDGHYWFDLPEPIGGFSKLKREKRMTPKDPAPDPDKTEKLCKKKGLWLPVDKGGVYNVVELIEIDADAINKAYFQDKLTLRELESILQPQKVTYAFVPQK